MVRGFASLCFDGSGFNSTSIFLSFHLSIIFTVLSRSRSDYCLMIRSEQIHYNIFAESITQWLEYNINKQTENSNECRKNAIVCYFYMCSKLICKITTNNNLKLNWLVDGNPMGLRNCLVQ